MMRDDFEEAHPIERTRGERIGALLVTCFITFGAGLMVTMLLA